MNQKINILVTGCGGDIGQSIGKILNEYELVNNLYGCDISEKNAGKFIYRNFFIGLPYSDPNYLKSLEEFVTEKEIDLIIPISEPELRFLSMTNNLTRIGRARFMTASDQALRVGFDKLSTANFLESAKLPFPVTKLIEEDLEVELFPVILKSRTGSGSSRVFIVKDQETFKFISRNNPDFIVQEYLEDSSGEFTCGLFRSRSGIVRTILFKRELLGGFSGYGEVIQDCEIEDLLTQIATKLNLVGSINVQLRLTNKGPVVFEINPRFSSTVKFRHMLGFKDVVWSIEDTLNLTLSNWEDNSVGKKFYKGFNEYIS